MTGAAVGGTGSGPIGLSVGLIDGDFEGTFDGNSLGLSDGDADGISEGDVDGSEADVLHRNDPVSVAFDVVGLVVAADVAKTAAAGILDAGGRWEEEGQRDRQLHVSENKLHAPTGTLQLSLPTINLYYGH